MPGPDKLIPGAFAAAGAIALALWLRSSPAGDLEARVPGRDRLAGTGVEEAAAPWQGSLTKGDGSPASLPGAWPRFRGPNFDNVGTENVPLARSWGPSVPKVLWSVDVGEGYAGAAVLGGRVYLLDYDRKGHADALRCLSLADGREIWRYSYRVKVKSNHGMSRTVPAVTEKYVVSLGPKCHVLCLDAASGELRWKIDLVNEHKTTVPPWYAGQCPLIEKDRAILAPGGDVLMMAVDCETGNTVWTTPNPDGWQMTHSSVMPMVLDGRRTYVYCGSGGVVGVSAEDGRVLWKTSEWKISIATVPSPVSVGDRRIFFTGGYGAGSLMIELKGEDGRPEATPVFRLKPKTFDSPQQTPILFGDHLYAVRSDGRLACLNLAGALVWESGGRARFGLGPSLIANGLIYVMNDTGVLTLVEATPAGYRQLAQAQVLQGEEAWGPMALAGGRLIVRDLTKMVCLDVRSQSAVGSKQ